MSIVAKVAASIVLVAVFSLNGTSPASAYRVFLDYNTDNNLYTFQNSVQGPLEVPITIVVVFGPEDAGNTNVVFDLTWECTEGPTCPAAHGYVPLETLTPAYPFANPEMTACLANTCGCMASRFFYSDLTGSITSGNWEFAVLPFSRQGWDPATCGPLTYQSVLFQVECPYCTYQPGDEAKRLFLLQGAPVAKDDSGWGRIKALYR